MIIFADCCLFKVTIYAIFILEKYYVSVKKIYLNPNMTIYYTNCYIVLNAKLKKKLEICMCRVS